MLNVERWNLNSIRTLKSHHVMVAYNWQLGGLNCHSHHCGQGKYVLRKKFYIRTMGDKSITCRAPSYPYPKPHLHTNLHPLDPIPLPHGLHICKPGPPLPRFFFVPVGIASPRRLVAISQWVFWGTARPLLRFLLVQFVHRTSYIFLSFLLLLTIVVLLCRFHLIPTRLTTKVKPIAILPFTLRTMLPQTTPSVDRPVFPVPCVLVVSVIPAR